MQRGTFAALYPVVVAFGTGQKNGRGVRVGQLGQGSGGEDFCVHIWMVQKGAQGPGFLEAGQFLYVALVEAMVFCEVSEVFCLSGYVEHLGQVEPCGTLAGPAAVTDRQGDCISRKGVSLGCDVCFSGSGRHDAKLDIAGSENSEPAVFRCGVGASVNAADGVPSERGKRCGPIFLGGP